RHQGASGRQIGEGARALPRRLPHRRQPGRRRGAQAVRHRYRRRLTRRSAMAEPLQLYRTPVRPEWIDYNGHMHEAYYVLVFGHTTDAFLDFIGMDAAYRERTKTSLYTVEGHIAFVEEVPLGTELRVATTIVASDAKRVHLFHDMTRGSDGARLATYELLV